MVNEDCDSTENKEEDKTTTNDDPALVDQNGQSHHVLDMSGELYAYHRARALERVHVTLQTNQQRLLLIII